MFACRPGSRFPICPAVDSDIVDLSVEPFAPDGVAAHAKRVFAGRYQERRACIRKHAVLVETQVGAVKSGGNVRPCICLKMGVSSGKAIANIDIRAVIVAVAK